MFQPNDKSPQMHEIPSTIKEDDHISSSGEWGTVATECRCPVFARACAHQPMASRGVVRWQYVFLSAVLLLLTSGLLEAQAPGTGAIAGSVTDPSGAAVPHAHVSVTSEETNLSRAVTTSSEGTFRVSLLACENYTLVIEASGFKRKIVRSTPVLVSEITVVDVKLEIGSTNTEVQVKATPELAQTESVALGRVTDEEMIVGLPLATRNFSQILGLNSGIVGAIPDAGALGRNNQDISANGAKTTANNFQFNGIDANNLSEGSFTGFGPEVGIAVPAPDVIAQFKVQTGMYDAGYGRSAGANIDLVSKAGTNAFHGSLWEFFRNDALNANDFFLKQNDQQRPELKQNQFGFTIGGPIRKNKTFFFTSYQGFIQHNGVASVAKQTALLPPLTDDRSKQALGNLFGGQSGALGGVAVAADGSNINPVALAFLNFKLPNGAFAIPTPQTILSPALGESTFSIPARYREDQFTVNLDHSFSQQNQLSGRFFYSRDPYTNPFPTFGPNLPGWGTSETDRNDMFVLSDTHIFTSNLVNVARFGFMRFDGLSVTSQPINATDVGMATPSNLPETPAIAVNGLFTIGTASAPSIFQNTNTFVWQDTVSLTRGKHNLRMGGEVKRHQLDISEPFVEDGFLFFLSFPDFLLGQSGAQNGSSSSNIFSSVGASGTFRKDERYTDVAGFIQDDIKLTPRLTVNAGLRYELFGTPSDIHGRLPTFDPTIATSQVPAGGSFSGFVLPANYSGPLPAGVVKSKYSGLWSPDYKDFSPRLGFALRVFDKPTVVLRGGYGIYYERLTGQLPLQIAGQPPFSFTQRFSGAQNTAATFQQPYNPPLPPSSSFPVFLPRVPGGGLSLAAVSRHVRSPYTQQYNLNVQYEFARDLVWQVGYVGSKTTHLSGCTEFNQALIATPQNPVNGETTTTLENLTQRLPFAGIAGGSYICGTTFSASYNSLQTSLTKRFSHGLDLLGSYTWSKNLDFTSGGGNATNFDLDFLTNDQTNPRQARGLNDFDRTHRFVLSFVYAPPKFEMGPAVVRYVLSYWQFSGIALLQSGQPITVVDSSAGSVYGNLPGFSRAECTGANPASSGSLTHRLKGYFNTAAFAPPPVIGDGTGFGNCGVGILRGPDQRNLDLGIQRNFTLTERSALQFRAEFFNFTNTPKFGLPVNDFATGPAFGLISSTASNPRIVQFALKYSF
jgi:hypothetical protein